MRRSKQREPKSTYYKSRHLHYCNSIKRNAEKWYSWILNQTKIHYGMLSNLYPHFKFIFLPFSTQLCYHISWLIPNSLQVLHATNDDYFCTSSRGDVCLFFAFLFELFVTVIFISMLFITNTIFQDLSFNSFHDFCWLFFLFLLFATFVVCWHYLVV